jgi:transcriptional regulator with XRE-family HTH domain
MKKNLALAGNVRAARERLGLSQFDLAVASRTSVGAISELERGRTPRFSTLQQIATGLKTTTAALLGGSAAAIHGGGGATGSTLG